MKNVNYDLVEGWRKCEVESPPYLFPGDESEIFQEDTILHCSFVEFARSNGFGSTSDSRLHIGLLPLPYVGNLAKASIFILLLNPGLSPGDYFAEQDQDGKYREALIRNLGQENMNDQYPFLFLDPQFAWHPGFDYWNKKFHRLVEALKEQRKVSYQEALSILAQQIACLELIPYHSESFGKLELLKKLKSTAAMKDYVNRVLVPRARRGNATIIVTRKVKYWGLGKHNNVVEYTSGEARAAHLTLNTRGGRAIALCLGIRRT